MADDAATSLRTAIDQVQGLVERLRTIRKRTDPQRLHDLVDARRTLAVQLSTLGTMTERALPATDEQRRRELGSLRSAARTALALHQTQWPAVKLKTAETGLDYRTSAMRVDSTIDALLSLAKAVLRDMA